jgi:hypothetical protein
VLRKELRDLHSGPFDDHRIGIHELKAEPVRHVPADRSLPTAHEADEDDVGVRSAHTAGCGTREKRGRGK